MYGKIFASLYQGTLRGRPDEILVFTNMIACCDKYGEVDKHPKAISDETGLPMDRVLAAIAVLEAPDLESRSREHDGARIVRCTTDRTWGWIIVNYLKYRSIRDEDSRREQNRDAVARHRARRAGVMSVSQCNHDVSKVSQGKPVKAQAEAEAEAEADGGGVAAAAPSGDDLFSPAPVVHVVRPKSFGDFQASHPRIYVPREERDAWEATLSTWGWDPMDEGYGILAKGLSSRLHRVLLSQMTAWLDQNFELGKKENK